MSRIVKDGFKENEVMYKIGAAIAGALYDLQELESRTSTERRMLVMFRTALDALDSMAYEMRKQFADQSVANTKD